MKKKYFIFTILLSLTVAMSCKKEEVKPIDNPAQSITQKDLLTDTWLLVESMNANDTTYYNNSDTTTSNDGSIVEFRDDFTTTTTSSGMILDGIWEFINQNNAIHLEYTSTSYGGNTYPISVSYDYEILKLDVDELWLFNASDTTEAHFVRYNQ